jgi:hypothetical protein
VTAQEMLALDLDFLAEWDFVGEIGDYKLKQVCVMSAAVAAVRVARGVDMNGATDELECVDPGVRKLCIPAEVIFRGIEAVISGDKP